MAICFCFFNPCNSRRILMNYLYTVNSFNIQGIPNYTIELVYNDRKPEIHKSFVVRANSYMFHKENLLRILEQKIPSHFKKLAFLDSDIFFSDEKWYDKVSELLETYDVVHPFEEAVWLDITFKKEIQRRKSAFLNDTGTYHWSFHPGFGVCFKRDFYRRVGFFDYSITGSSDTLSVVGWMKQKYHTNYTTLIMSLQEKYDEFFAKPAPKLTYLKGVIVYHLFHGTMKNRQYEKRHSVLDNIKDASALIKPNGDGVFEWIDKEKWNPIFYAYFKNREDDGVD